MEAEAKLSFRTTAYRAVGTALLGLGLMVTIGAVSYGLSNVTEEIQDSCGNGFTSTQSIFTATGEPADACAAAESSREAVTHGLLGAGLVGIAFSAVVFAFAARAKDEEIDPGQDEPGASRSPSATT